MVEPALIVPPDPDERWHLATQMGVEKAVIHPLEIGDGRTDWTYDDLQGLSNWLESAGLEFAVLEGSVLISDRIRFGREGRDEDIAVFKRFVRDCGAVGVPVICYDWMAGVRWARTAAHVPARGGSYVTEFDVERTQARGSPGSSSGPGSDHDPSPASEVGDVTHEDVWEALEHFLAEVVPVAEEAGVRLALHPDDPPRESLRGIPRVVTSIDAYDRVLDASDSPANAITFCQGNFAAMGVDIPDAIEHFGEDVAFVHFRDIEGDADRFTETWHDNGPTDMLAAMEAYETYVENDVPMRPDHVPTVAGEDNSNPGYHTKARLFAIGYMRGLSEQANVG